MSEKAKIIKCLWTNEWAHPKGDKIHYHELTLSNGNIESCGAAEKYPEKLKEGKEIEYDIVKGKVKLVSNSDQPAARSNSSSTGAKKQYGKPIKQTDFLGYSYSYAKDLVVAGKTTKKDRENLKSIAEEIYAHIGVILNGKPDEPEG